MTAGQCEIKYHTSLQVKVTMNKWNIFLQFIFLTIWISKLKLELIVEYKWNTISQTNYYLHVPVFNFCKDLIY